MRKLAVVVMVLALAGAGCSAERDGVSEAAIEVVASFYPLFEAAERVGGEDASVTNLTPPGVEAHDVELTASQLDRIIDADVVLYLGEGFQPAVEEAIPRAQGAVVDLLEGIDLVEGEAHDHAHDEDEHGHDEDDHAHDEDDDHVDEEHVLDPHVWLDPQRMSEMVDRVAEAFAAAAPEAGEGFASRAASYRSELERLDADFESGLANCERNLFVTNHASFGYLAMRYGLEQEAVSGLSPSEEPGPARLADLIDLVEREGVPMVFTEVLASPRVSETLAREAGVEVGVLDPIEGLTEDRLTGGADYLSVMRENLSALQEALDCG